MYESYQEYNCWRGYAIHTVVLQTSLSRFDVSMQLQHLAYTMYMYYYHSCVVIGCEATLQVHYRQTVYVYMALRL